MAAAIVTIIVIALIVVGGMTLSQGILTTADTTSISVQEISVREGDMMRTDLDVLRAAQLSWGDYLRVTVKNSGQTKLASFDRWDMIASYESGDDTLYSTWLQYNTSLPGNNEWYQARIGLNGPTEYFEPGILNPEEEMVILADLFPLPGSSSTGDITLTTPNGVYDSIALVNPGIMRLTAQEESIYLSGSKYYELVEAAAADNAGMMLGIEYDTSETGRRLLYCNADPSRPAKFIYPLIGIEEIPAQEWTVYYDCRVSGGVTFPQSDSDTEFNIDILVRHANGTVKDTIATEIATANVTMSDAGSWVTLSGTYDFTGYTDFEDDDYLEIDFYGKTTLGPLGDNGLMEIRVDDIDLAVSDQTRIEAY